MPPEITIANSAKLVSAWDPTVELQVGKVDNGLVDEDDTVVNTVSVLTPYIDDIRERRD